MQVLHFFVGILIISFLSSSCNDTPTTSISKEEKPPSLHSVFQDDFYVGAALSKDHILGTDSEANALLEKEFNSITPENIMKWMYIHPAPDSFDFKIPDQFIDLANKNKMQTVGHALVWHSQLAPWVEEITDSTILMQQLEKHITTIVQHFKGRIDAWDVVNEALNEDGTMRESMFYKVLGDDYVTEAFRIAQKVDPDVELYYNDYNIEQKAKREGAIRLIKKIQEAGVKIDGVGIQGHWSLLGASVELIEEAIEDYAALGIKVMFTELDVTALPNPWDLEGAEVSQNFEDFEGKEFMDPFRAGLPDSMQVKMADRYEELFALFLKHADKIDRITFWGVNDGHSWLNGWPIKGRTNYPLLFDRNFQPKKAYHQVMALKEKTTPKSQN